MKITELLNELGVDNFRDRAFLYKIISIFKGNNQCDNFVQTIINEFERDYSTIRKRMKRIIESNENNISNVLDIQKDKLTSKAFVQKLIKKTGAKK
ncbi:hypothetical protein Curi_c14190 [Gottschalkia acidurici 9a]|uniref:Uncharacterized protein n=1 Tax=Gottschalkia acidurici (strain ATCC 7906 / DSM 604 / BCRC 14475 / CIP 104303 / KCTC 5404 / NCIMB 10678 / 9a) TaxID=1128398 RepID=K0AYV6_GOTA9|nr:hypothetical protein [Gottschalkia acidurici]AFS78429.1 hypothetical protein Curi_c14190 [Gottschalkia acidurici 9a]